MTGIITSFRPDLGTGWITGDAGEEFFLHYGDVDSRRERKHLKRGRKVTFEPVEEGKDHRKAANVHVELPEVLPPHERTGRGVWMKTDVKGRVRCSDCNCTTELSESPFCPHCGASMNPDSVVQEGNNEAERTREEPLWRWTKLEYGYRCGCCKLVYAYPSKFCPHCGKLIRKNYDPGCQKD